MSDRECDRGICGHAEHTPKAEGQLTFDHLFSILTNPAADVESYVVPGLPVPQGSMNAPRAGLVIHSRGAALEGWRDTVGWTVRARRSGPPWSDCPVTVGCEFVLPRPASVKRKHPHVKPDLDKLLRAVLDALTGIVYSDDSQVVGASAVKVYVGSGEPAVLRNGGLRLHVGRV